MTRDCSIIMIRLPPRQYTLNVSAVLILSLRKKMLMSRLVLSALWDAIIMASDFMNNQYAKEKILRKPTRSFYFLFLFIFRSFTQRKQRLGSENKCKQDL